LSACQAIGNAAGSVVNEYHTLITGLSNSPENGFQFPAVRGPLAMGTIYTQATFLQNYQQADIEKSQSVAAGPG